MTEQHTALTIESLARGGYVVREGCRDPDANELAAFSSLKEALDWIGGNLRNTETVSRGPPPLSDVLRPTVPKAFVP